MERGLMVQISVSWSKSEYLSWYADSHLTATSSVAVSAASEPDTHKMAKYVTTASTEHFVPVQSRCKVSQIMKRVCASTIGMQGVSESLCQYNRHARCLREFVPVQSTCKISQIMKGLCTQSRTQMHREDWRFKGDKLPLPAYLGSHSTRQSYHISWSGDDTFANKQQTGSCHTSDYNPGFWLVEKMFT